MRQAACPVTAAGASQEARRFAGPGGPIEKLLPPLLGIAAALALTGLYLGLVSWAQGLAHARQLLWDDRYFVGAISLGFGTQAALYTYVRLVAKRARLAATGVTAAATGTSTAAMVACCAHHVADALPLLGLSAAAVFLTDYRLPIMGVGLAMNLAGIVIVGRLALQSRAAARLAGAQP
ncbi:MAG: hypothetical protein KGK07_02365 [Chloroflexota bacterium]|nr:hypothetical protein [Chloroflexota bacterium]